MIPLQCQQNVLEDDEYKFIKPLNRVVCRQTGESYLNMKDAENANGYIRGTIMSYIQGVRRLSKHWELENFEVQCYES